MSIPVTGIVLIPLGFLIALLPWRYCVIGLMAFAMMTPAAVVNVGNFGLQPGFYLAILLVARTAIEIASHGFRLNAYVLMRMRLLFLYLVVAFVVLFIALAFFQGRVDTLPGSVGFKSDALRPFRLSRENFTQIGYLILNLALVYSLGHQAARESLPRLLKAWDMALVTALLFGVAVCFWQFASQFGGPAFPSGFFYSNVGYGRSENQTMAGFLRISGPLGEPSALGYSFTGLLLFAWLRYRLFPTALSASLIAASGLCLVISTSTTAFLGILIFCCLAMYDLASGRIHLATRTISSGQIAAIAIGAAVLTAVLAVVAAKGPELYVVLEKTVFQKGESSSFQERSFADLQGMQILVDTYGFGVGLGSHKANSLVLTLLSNTGIAGMLIFAAFVYGLLSWTSLLGNSKDTRTLRRTLAPFEWGLIGLLAMHAFSNPNFSTLQLWVQMGGLLALQTAIRSARPAYEPAAPRIALAEMGLALPQRKADRETQTT
jgi:hypothetical protein